MQSVSEFRVEDAQSHGGTREEQVHPPVGVGGGHTEEVAFQLRLKVCWERRYPGRADIEGENGAENSEKLLCRKLVGAVWGRGLSAEW